MDIKGYEWKEGYGYSVDPEDAHSELNRIEERYGKCTAETVVQAAKSKRSPIHSVFNWDDTSAAHEHRKEQARSFIRALVVVYEVEPQVEQRIRVFHNGHSPGPTYEHIIRVMEAPHSREALLAKALKDLAAWRNKYAVLNELSKVFTAADELVA